MVWRGGLFLLFFLFHCPVFSQERVIREYVRSFLESAGPRGAVAGEFEYRLEGDRVYFRHSTGPADEPFRQLALPGKGIKLAATPERLYVWVGDSLLLEFQVGKEGPDEPGSPLPVNFPAALEALRRPELAAPGTAAAKSEAAVVISPPRLLVANTGSGVSGGISGDSVTAINTATDQVISTIPLTAGDAPIDIVVAPDNSAAYTANFGCETCFDRGYSVIDPDRMRLVSLITPGEIPTAIEISSDGSKLYAGDGNIVRAFNAATSAVSGTFNMPMPVQDLALTSDGRTLYVLGSSLRQQADRVVALNTADMSSRVFFDLPQNSACAIAKLTPDQRRLFVSCLNNARIFQLDPTSLSVVGTWVTTPSLGMAFSPDGRKLYVTHLESGTVEILDAANGARLKQISTGRGPFGVVVNRSGTRGYVANVGANTVTVLDLVGETALSNVNVGPAPIALALTIPATEFSLTPAQLTFTASAGQANPAAQTVALAINQQGSFTWTARATTQSGGNWLSASPASGTFPATLSISVNLAGLAAGTYAGTIAITVPNASNSPQNISVSLRIGTAPVVPPGGLVNASSFTAPVAAGSLVSIFGTNLGPASPVSASVLPLPAVLGDTRVTMGGFPAPLVFVSATQINCQAPVELLGQSSASLVVQTGSVSSTPVTVPLGPSAPGIFVIRLGSRDQGAILNQDSTLNLPTNPARPGEAVQIFATGQGTVSNMPPSGSPASGTLLSTTPSLPTVLIGGQEAEVIFSGLTPGAVGLWQINARVPAGVSPGESVSVQIVHQGVTSNSVLLAVAAPAGS